MQTRMTLADPNAPVSLPSSGRRSSKRRWLIVALCSQLYIVSQFFRVANAVIAPQLQRDLGLTSEALGLMSAVFFYVFALAQLPLGPCLDRIGARVTMTVLSLTAALGALLFATAQGISGAALGRGLLGLGMAGNLMGSMMLLTRWFSPREFATLGGLIMAIGTLGNMAAATPLALMAAAMGWRWSFGLMAGVTACLSLIFFLCVRDAPAGTASLSRHRRARPDGPSVSRMARVLLTRSEYWLISSGTFFRYGTFVAIQGLWAGPYLMEILRLTPVQAGNLLVLLNMGMVMGSPFGGWLSDRVLSSRKWVVVLGLTTMAAAVLALALGWGRSHLWAMGAVLLVLGVGGSFGLVMYAHIKEIMPREMTGMALTGVNFFTMLGGAVFMHLMGMVLDLWSAGGHTASQGYRAAFLLGFAGIALASLLYLFTRDAPVGDEPR